MLPTDCSSYANNQGAYPPVSGQTQTATSGPYCQVETGGIDIGSPTAGGASQLGVYPRLSYSSNPSSNVVTGGGLDGISDLEYAAIRLPNQNRGNQFNARGDWHATASDLVAGSVYFTRWTALAPAAPTARVPRTMCPSNR